MDELKPCPFCGGTPMIDRGEIFCDCGVSIKFEQYYYEVPISKPATERWGIAKKCAIEVWNGRYNDGKKSNDL